MARSTKNPEERRVYRGQVPGGVRRTVLVLLLLMRPDPVASQNPQDVEEVFWDSVKECTSARQIQTYLEQYPSGRYVTQAQACLEDLEKRLGLDRTARTSVQQGLTVLDYSPGPADGSFGPTTRQAIQAWQQAKGYAATGYLTRDQADTLIAQAPSPVDPVDQEETPDYLDQVRAQLDLIKLAAASDGWEETHNPKFDGLGDGDSDSFWFTLEEGKTYQVVSVCDEDCSDIDLTLYDENGDVTSRDISTDSLPMVEASPSRTGRFRLEVEMHSCSSSICFYGISVFGRESPDYLAQVKAQLDQIKLRVGDSWGDEWEETHGPKFDALNDGDSDSFNFTLEEGKTYRVVSVCDADCSDLDLTLYDESDDQISKDTETDDLPIVEVSPSRTGRFRLEVEMYSCRSSPCLYGISIFGRELQVAEPQAQLTPEARNSIGMEFVLIESGTFEMGSPVGEAGRDDDELLHQVTISQPFYLGKYEVTQGQWEAMMGTNPSEFSSCGSDCPVERVSWEDAQAFIAALNRREGVNVYRLPTEAEWEYAARGGTQTAYSFGDGANELRQHGWYTRNSDDRTHPVGGKRPNAFGLYDMHGNVWEWVADWYGDYSHGLVIDPSGPATGIHRVFRGGCWSNAARRCRVSYRNHDTPGDRLPILGFRLARPPDPMP